MPFSRRSEGYAYYESRTLAPSLRLCPTDCSKSITDKKGKNKDLSGQVQPVFVLSGQIMSDEELAKISGGFMPTDGLEQGCPYCGTKLRIGDKHVDRCLKNPNSPYYLGR